MGRLGLWVNWFVIQLSGGVIILSRKRVSLVTLAHGKVTSRVRPVAGVLVYYCNNQLYYVSEHFKYCTKINKY